MSEVIAGLSQLLGLAQGIAWAAALAFVRIGAMVALMPGLGDPSVPQRVKLALVVAFTLVVTPILADRIGPDATPTVLALGGEVVAGLLLGVGMRLFTVALQTAAAMIACCGPIPGSTGTSSARALRPGTKPPPAFSSLPSAVMVKL